MSDFPKRIDPFEGDDFRTRVERELPGVTANDVVAARTFGDVRTFGEIIRDHARGRAAPELLGTAAMAAAPAMVELLSTHPVVSDGAYEPQFADVFGDDRDPAAEVALVDGLDALARGAIALALSGRDDEALVDAVLATALGVDDASAELRERLLATRAVDRDPDKLAGLGRPRPIDFDRLQKVVLWGTVRELMQAFARAGRAQGTYAAWAGRATANANGITGLDPGRGCAGSRITIEGSGFGNSQPAFTTVRVPTRGGGCRDVEAEWSEDAIRIVLPDDVGIGCVGFLVTDGPAPSDPVGARTELQAAAGMFQSVLGDAFGAAGVMFGQTVVDAAANVGFGASLPCPPCLPAAADGTVPNRLVGGPPVIKTFTVNGRQSSTIRPGDAITLAWDVEGADAIAISRRMVGPNRWPDPPTIAALPQVNLPAPVPAAGSVGPFAVPWDGYDDWNGEYVLEVSNPCAAAPVTASVRIEMREVAPLFGIADTHVHFVSHLAFAGYGIFGAPHASDPALTGDAALADALPWCSGPNGHGPGGVLPSLEGVGGHLVGGYDQFDGWPRHTTLAHQQAYVDWIKRAVDGGLRLVVCLAVNNELVADRMTELYGANLSTDDKTAIDRQLDAIDAMVQFVNDQAGGQGWMEVANTPADARRIVSSGRLAVVKGVEVDSLGGWHTPAELEADATNQGRAPEELVAEVVEDLYKRGVRHVFPIHATNNAYGGPALFIRNYDAVNYYATGQSFEVETADPALGITYRIDEDTFEGGGVAAVLAYYGIAAAVGIAGATLMGVTLGGLIGGPVGAIAGGAAAAAGAASSYPTPPQTPASWSSPGGHINTQGLTQHGETLIDELMRHGMLIDVDHMGHHTTEGALTRLEAQGYPAVSGHTGFRELKYGWRPSLADPNAQYSAATADDFGTHNVKRLASEVDKTPDHLRRLRQLSGMVSPITYQRDVRDCGCGYGSLIPNDNAGSSKSFAQAYLYAHFHMHGRHVGLGTDINGAGQLPGPRFGPQGAASIREEVDWRQRANRGRPLRFDQVFAQRNGVRYSTPLVDYRHHRYMDYAGSPAQAPFDAEQRDFWESIAIWRSGTAPEFAEQPSSLQRTVATQNFIINLATGLRATARSQIPIAIPFASAGKPWPLFSENTDEQLAAFLASHPNEQLQPSDSQRTRDLVAKLGSVWTNWQRMEEGAPGVDPMTINRFGPAPGGSGLYDSVGRLTRSTAGRRDFDINIDGMAHYGMLPDLLQDMRNVGVQQLDALYRSAEDYIRVWERCEARKLP